MFSVSPPFSQVVEFDHECFPKIISSLVNILYMGEPGIANWAETGSVFLPLEPALIALSVHFPRPYNDPRNTEPGDRPYQPGARPFTVTGDPEVQALAEANIVTGVVEFGFEVDQVNVHLHGYLQTKEGLLIRAALLFLFRTFYIFIYRLLLCFITSLMAFRYLYRNLLGGF
jgi:hypothetical protein